MPKSHYMLYEACDAEKMQGAVSGLYGRMPAKLQKLVRKIRDAHNSDYAAMELLDAYNIEWRTPDKSEN